MCVVRLYLHKEPDTSWTCQHEATWLPGTCSAGHTGECPANSKEPITVPHFGDKARKTCQHKALPSSTLLASRVFRPRRPLPVYEGQRRASPSVAPLKAGRTERITAVSIPRPSLAALARAQKQGTQKASLPLATPFLFCSDRSTHAP